MKINELLPIGSIVLLKEGKKRLMITGVKQTHSEDGKEYDYIGVLYPEGQMGPRFQYMFNHENIQDIVFRGYEDAERVSFLVHLGMVYDAETEKKEETMENGFAEE